MDEKHKAQKDDASSAKPRARWMRPELYSFEAGSAEAGDFTSADGNINS